MHAHSAGTRQGCAQESLCAFLLCSSTASRGKVPKMSTLCLHFYVFLLCISIVFLLFSAYYPLLFQHYFSIMHCISLCISNDCEASQSHPYDQKSKPITATKEVKPFYYAYSNQTSETFSVSIGYVHFCCSGLLWAAAGDCRGMFLAWIGPKNAIFRVQNAIFRVQNAITGSECHLPEVQRDFSGAALQTRSIGHGVTKKELVLERFKVQKSTPFGSVLGGQKGVISLSSA